MNHLKQFLFLSLVAGFLFISCSDSDDPIVQEDPNIVELAQENTQLSILVDAVVKAGLDGTLSGTGPFTVFAPTNAAFTALLQANGFGSLDDIPVATLTEILLNHVVSGNVRSSDLSTDYYKSLASGPGDTNLDLFIDLTSGVTINGNANVTSPDNEADNGIVHIIDQVIVSPTVVNHALANPTFSILVDALTTEGLAADYVSIFSGDGPFTVFAPTNDAFVALLESNPDWNSLADISTEILDAVLTYHVVSGANVEASSLTDEMEVETLNGSITIDLDNGPQIKTSSGGVSNIIVTDVQGTNGIVHAIDAVLVPDDPAIQQDPTIVEIAQGDDRFSILVDAVVKAGFVDILNGDGPFTVFAPTNDAFVTLLNETGFSSLDDIPLETLQHILLNHVVGEEKFSTDLSTDYVKSLSSGPNSTILDLYINLDNGVTINKTSNVIIKDLDAKNGVIHAINRVIDMPTVVTHALSNPDFSILVQALTRSDLTKDYVSILSGDGPFTVFAPNNDAFVALLESNEDWNALEDIPVEVLEAVLDYHVIQDANVESTMLSDEMEVQTLNGTFTVDLDTGVQIKTTGGGTSNVIATDVQGTNGIIHVIDAVLIP